MARIITIIFVGVMLCSDSNGQVGLGMDWFRGLTDGIDVLNRNVHQLNQRIQQTVQSNVAHVQRLTENLNQDAARGSVQTIQGNTVILSSNDDGTRIVSSGRTSDGRVYVLESTEKIENDTLRHVQTIYDPATNTSKVYGYTLNLKDRNASPIPLGNVA